MGRLITEEVDKDASLSDIIKIVQGKRELFKNPWFRGQSNYEYKLIPSLFRKGSKIGCEYDERIMIDEFKRRYHEWGNVQRTEFEWLSLMQHYGYPTRLLDWTTNIMVALYFACHSLDKDKEEKENSCDAALYVYEEDKVKEKTLEIISLSVVDSLNIRNNIINLEEKLIEVQMMSDNIYNFANLFAKNIIPIIKEINSDKSYIMDINEKCLHNEHNFLNIISVDNNIESITVTYDAVCRFDIIEYISPAILLTIPYTDNRMRHQHAGFTVHSGKYFDMNPFMLPRGMEDCIGASNHHLLKIKIPADAKKKILDELSYAGINKATLFPEMEYQVESIKDIARFKPS